MHPRSQPPRGLQQQQASWDQAAVYMIVHPPCRKACRCTAEWGAAVYRTGNAEPHLARGSVPRSHLGAWDDWGSGFSEVVAGGN